VVELQDAVATHAGLLRDARERELELVRLLPICPNCHRIRSDADYWLAVEGFLDQHLPDRNAGQCCWCATPAESAGTSALVAVNEVNSEYVRAHQ
jgi:hypothetical protein